MNEINPYNHIIEDNYMGSQVRNGRYIYLISNNYALILKIMHNKDIFTLLI